MGDIWNAAPKFPEPSASETDMERIDVDSFIQIYRDIDDIFEDEEGDEDKNGNEDGNEIGVDTDMGMESEDQANYKSENDGNGSEAEEYSASAGVNENEKEVELTQAFSTICDGAGYVSQPALANWADVKELLDYGDLSLTEFEEMWDRTPKSPGSGEMIDVDGFLSFNVALDDLFETMPDNEELESTSTGAQQQQPEQIAMFYGEDLPPAVIFSEISDDNYLVGKDEMRQWGDLQDMLREGELLPLELQNIMEGIPKAKGTNDKMDEEGFTTLCEAIDNLFEDDEDMEGEAEQGQQAQPAPAPEPPIVSVKPRLLDLVSELAKDEDRLPCGLESTETEVELMIEIASALETEPTNMVRAATEIEDSDIAGDWELLYTTSSTMKFNKSLTGLVPPNGKFGGLVQTLKASKYLQDMEYVEQINAGPASFEVKVNGDWEIRSSVSLFTGEKSFCLDVLCDKVNYGLNSQKADHWKTLGPLNLLNIGYLDSDLRIMRGSTSTNSIFVFRRL